MAETFFHTAKKNGLLGLFFTMSGIPSDEVQNLSVKKEEKDILCKADKCVKFLKTRGVSKSILENTKQKDILIKMSALPLDKKKNLALKFVNNIANNKKMQNKLHLLSKKTEEYIFPTFAKESEEWKLVEVSDDEDESVETGMDPANF